MKSKRPQNYLVDPTIVPRLQEFLEVCETPVVDLEAAADYLLGRFWEYKRKKRSVFLAAIRKAYDIIVNSKKTKESVNNLAAINVEDSVSRKQAAKFAKVKRKGKRSAEESYSSDNDGYVNYKDTNMANSSLSSLYCSRRTSRRHRSLDGGSSDDVKLNGFGSQSANFAVDRARAPIREVEIVDIIDQHQPNDNSNPRFLSPPDTSATQAVHPNMNQTQSSFPPGNKRARFDVTLEESPAPVKARPLEEGNVRKGLGKNGRTQKHHFGGASSASAVPQFDFQMSSVTFADIGGCDEALTELCKLLVHMKHPEIFCRLGITPPRGFLLHGPPGCGKTLLAHAVAGEFKLPFLCIAATEIISGVSGDSEQKLRDIFTKAANACPCIVFIDEIDAITPKRESVQREMERRIVAQLLACLDDMSRNVECRALFIGATNRPESLDPALRRAGRFDKEIALGIPDEKARAKILHVICKGLCLESGFNFLSLARKTPGFVGADLSALAQEACVCAVERIFHKIEQGADVIVVEQSSLDTMAPDTSISSNSNVPTTSQNQKLSQLLCWLKNDAPLNVDLLDSLNVEMADFEKALKLVHPSAKREGFATVPDVGWKDIGALSSVREELKWSILYPIQHPERFEAFGLHLKPQGILLFGPPGCGKTLLAKAVANETGMNFISVKGPELLSMYVGESERAVRQVFLRARNSAPCVIFFDELDALCPRRSEHDHGGATRVVNQLLTEMDGIEDRKQVFLIGATNRPDIIDPAILRPGRLDKTIYVGFPSADDRADILRALTKDGTRPPLDGDVNVAELAQNSKLDCFSGADLAAVVREASVLALKETMNAACVGSKTVIATVDDQKPRENGLNTTSKDAAACVKMRHFLAALDIVTPSVSAKERMTYEQLKLKFDRIL